MPSNDAGMECGLSRRLREQGRIVETVDWLKAHRDHGDIRDEDAGHPLGDLRRLVCECGSVHLTMKNTEAIA